LGALIVLIIIVVVPVYFTVIKPKNNNAKGGLSGGPGGSSGNGPTKGGDKPQSPTGAITGGDGSTVLLADGSSFTYNNPFGGIWYSDPNDPFNNNARPNSWTPPLNTSWTWGKDKINGVNIGGLFVLEPFITPALFQKYPTSVDEWTLSQLMAADTANGGMAQLEHHYDTFITEQDIAQIAGAGLNWVRLPIPYWVVETWPGEPFLARTSWKYIVRLIGWCRKYGLRVNLDLHTIPGSQNGLNHSGRLGQINFLNGVMGIANAQRALDYIRIIAEFISQDQYKDVVPFFGIMNEAYVSTIGKDQLTRFYLQAHNIIRGITGIGKGPYISIHDGFQGAAEWAGFLPGSDRMALDLHPYFAFSGGPASATIETGTGPTAGGTWPAQACNAWGTMMNTSQTAFGVTTAGEFSGGFNDCGLYLKGIPGSSTFGGDCSVWQDASKWNDAQKAGVQAFISASMDALGDWFFWTWKVGNSSTSTSPTSPLWSYSLGLQLGYIPKDPRSVLGRCQSLGVTGSKFDGNYLPWQTGGAGAGTISPSAVAAFSQYPPATISNVAAAAMPFLPTYAETGPLSTLPPGPANAKATKSVDLGDGWFNAADTGGMATPIPSCTYAPDAWSALSLGAPTAGCGGGLGQGAVGGDAAPTTAAAGAGAGAATTTTRGAAGGAAAPTVAVPPVAPAGGVPPVADPLDPAATDAPVRRRWN